MPLNPRSCVATISLSPVAAISRGGLSSTHLAPAYEALLSLAELKVMKRTCDGMLETSLLALCLQKLSQLIFSPKELQTYTGSAGSF